jgi:hypothetical protein
VSLDEWSKDSQDFPYTFLFKNVSPERVIQDDNGLSAIRIAPSDAHQSKVVARIVGQGSANGFSISDNFLVNEKVLGDVPFTCLRLGPFPSEQNFFLMRFECHIGGSSFSDLIPEDLDSATRLYRVYGPDHIFRHIGAVDMPQALASSNASAFDAHAALMETLREHPERIILPRRYSIIAVDHPNCRPATLKTLELTEDLRCLTSQISQHVYENPTLGLIKDRLHWFLCDSPSKGFFLQLAGPMALSDLPSTVGAPS